MTVDEVIKYFQGVDRAAKFFGVTREAIYLWRKRGGLVPRGRATEAQVRTNGDLIYKPELYGKH